MNEANRPWFYVIALFVIIILMSFSTCHTINRREADWRRWAEEAEELGYYRGYEDGYEAGGKDAARFVDMPADLESAYNNGYDDGYYDGYQDGHYTGAHGME